MKVVLQHKISLLYFGGDGNWTEFAGEARDFGASLKAMDFVKSQKLEETHVVLKFDDTQYDIVLQAFVRPGISPGEQSRL